MGRLDSGDKLGARQGSMISFNQSSSPVFVFCHSFHHARHTSCLYSSPVCLSLLQLSNYPAADVQISPMNCDEKHVTTWPGLEAHMLLCFSSCWSCCLYCRMNYWLFCLRFFFQSSHNIHVPYIGQLVPVALLDTLHPQNLGIISHHHCVHHC